MNDCRQTPGAETNSVIFRVVAVCGGSFCFSSVLKNA